MGYVRETIDFARYLRETECESSVRPAGAYADSLVREISHDRTYEGDALPWPKMAERFRLRPRELTIWLGYTKHGKSAVLSEAMLGMMAAKRTVGVISPEFPAIELLSRKVRQSAGSTQPTERYIRAWSDWANPRLYVFDRQASLDPEMVLGVVAYMIRAKACAHVVIDSLMKCGIRGSDGSLYAEQKAFVDRLQNLAHNSEDTHIHLVVHARKPDGADDSKPPGMYGAKGASEIVDMAENVVIVHMHKRVDEKDPDRPNVTVTVEAQRNAPRSDESPRFGLWFAPGLRFVGAKGQHPAPYFATERLQVVAR